MAPQTLYAKSGEVSLAYQVFGEGPLDLVYAPGWVSHVEEMWEEPNHARMLERLASFSRLILFDKRGTGLSDRVNVNHLPSLEVRMDDLRAVMDAAGSKRAALFGTSEAGVMSLLFAATYPERTRAVVAYGTYAKRVWSEDYPWAPTPEEREKDYQQVERDWGGPAQLQVLAPSAAGDLALQEWWSRYLRRAASPGAAVALLRMNTEIDIRAVLPSIRVPTLLIHRSGDLDIAAAGSRWMASQIPGARYVELPGADHLWFVGDWDLILDEVQEFLVGSAPAAEPDRVLTTLVFTDIASSTEMVGRVGDRRWKDLLAAHGRITQRQLARFRGREIDTAGDGLFAAFDGPARAVRCALAIQDESAALGLSLRSGVHTGECEVDGERLRGIAVHIAARVMAEARPGEVLASSTVKDLVSGSGLSFDDRGLKRLKGVAGEWRLFAAGSTR